MVFIQTNGRIRGREGEESSLTLSGWLRGLLGNVGTSGKHADMEIGTQFTRAEDSVKIWTQNLEWITSKFCLSQKRKKKSFTLISSYTQFYQCSPNFTRFDQTKWLKRCKHCNNKLVWFVAHFVCAKLLNRNIGRAKKNLLESLATLWYTWMISGTQGHFLVNTGNFGWPWIPSSIHGWYILHMGNFMVNIRSFWSLLHDVGNLETRVPPNSPPSPQTHLNSPYTQTANNHTGYPKRPLPRNSTLTAKRGEHGWFLKQMVAFYTCAIFTLAERSTPSATFIASRRFNIITILTNIAQKVGKAGDKGQVRCDRSQVTHDRLYMKRDTWHIYCYTTAWRF